VSPAIGGSAEVLSEILNQVAFVTLNRPAALNALSFGMIVGCFGLAVSLIRISAPRLCV
jgi:enoyl-CoA hydratase/carnithine racemase